MGISRSFKNQAMQSPGETHWFERKSTIIEIVSLIEKYAGKGQKFRLLDIGCAEGKITAELTALGLEVTGLDNDPRYIKFAQQNYPGTEFIVGDVESLDERFTNRYDIVLCQNTLFCTDLTKSLPGIERAMKPHGVGIITLDERITGIKNGKILYEQNVQETLKLLQGCRVLNMEYKERLDDKPIRHKHQYYQIVIGKGSR